MDPQSPPSHSSFSSASFPILAISILGILTTAILLLTYYILVIKCCLNWRRPDLLLLRSRRFRHRSTPPSPQPRGLDSSTINSIPTLRFSTAAAATSTVECSICLADFQHQELLRLLPNCSHAFHFDCIDTWLQSNDNCPLCRAQISQSPIQHFLLPQQTQEQQQQQQQQDSSSSASSRSVVIEIIEHDSSKQRKLWHMASMGDECIDMRRGEKDERFAVQPIRRSFSMDSSNDRQLYVSVQEILMQNPSWFREEIRNGEGSSGSGGRIRRSFFSFSRSSRSAAVLPVQSEL